MDISWGKGFPSLSSVTQEQVAITLGGGSAGSSHRAVSCLALMKRKAEEEGLNTGSAEEQPGVSLSCQQGNNVLGSSVATNITPHFKAPSNQSGESSHFLAVLGWGTTSWKRSSTTICSNFTSNRLLMGCTVLITLAKTVFLGILIKGWGAKRDRAGTNLAVASLRNTRAPGSKPKLSDEGSARSMTTLSLPLLKTAREIQIWGF